MPNAGHQEFADLALELLSEEGFSTRLRRFGAASGPKHNPTPGAAVDLDVWVAKSRIKTQEVDGQRVLATDTKLLIAPEAVDGSAVTVTTDHLIEIGGAFRKVEHFERIAPGDLTCLWVAYTR